MMHIDIEKCEKCGKWFLRTKGGIVGGIDDYKSPLCSKCRIEKIGEVFEEVKDIFKNQK